MMKIAIRRMAAGIALAAAVAWTGLAETVTNVRGMQRENSNLVDIYYDIEATDGGKYTVKVEIEGRTNEVTAATFTGDVGDGIAPGRNRHILWNAGADWPGKKGDVRVIVTATKQPEEGKHRGGQLWEGGPYWADRNIGASAPEDYGLYFWWGDTMGHRLSSDGTFGFSFDYDNAVSSQTIGKTIGTLLREGWIVSRGDYEYVLAPAHDAAHVKWGGAWRIPTAQELDDLCYKCDWTWTTMNGVNGYVVRGRGAYASKSIFLPAAGFGYGNSLDGSGSTSGWCWSSEPYFNDDCTVYSLYFYINHNMQRIFNYYLEFNERCYGLTVRPVQGFTN